MDVKEIPMGLTVVLREGHVPLERVPQIGPSNGPHARRQRATYSPHPAHLWSADFTRGSGPLIDRGHLGF